MTSAADDARSARKLLMKSVSGSSPLGVVGKVGWIGWNVSSRAEGKRKMNHDLRIERVIDAAPEEVFDAFTDADAITEWWKAFDGWSVEVVSCDVQVGGTTTIVFGEAASLSREDMMYTEVDRPHRLSWTDVFTMPDGTGVETTLVVTFEGQAEKTLMTIVQAGFPSAESRDRHQGGWPGFLERLERVAIRRRHAS
jgi:uncharacterized protein YndB with AHSA1/START domain